MQASTAARKTTFVIIVVPVALEAQQGTVNSASAAPQRGRQNEVLWVCLVERTRCFGCAWQRGRSVVGVFCRGRGVVGVFGTEDEVLWVSLEERTGCGGCVWKTGLGVVGVFGREDEVLWVCVAERTGYSGCVWNRGRTSADWWSGQRPEGGGNQFESTAKTHICRNGNDTKYEIALSKCAHWITSGLNTNFTLYPNHSFH